MSADQAIENFRTYLRIKTVQPKPDYGNLVYAITVFGLPTVKNFLIE